MPTRRSLLQSALATLGTLLTFGLGRLGLGGKPAKTEPVSPAIDPQPEASPPVLSSDSYDWCWAQVRKNLGGGGYIVGKVEHVGGGFFRPVKPNGFLAREANGNDAAPLGHYVRCMLVPVGRADCVVTMKLDAKVRPIVEGRFCCSERC
jgi:hypothetical protein